MALNGIIGKWRWSQSFQIRGIVIMIIVMIIINITIIILIVIITTTNILIIIRNGIKGNKRRSQSFQIRGEGASAALDSPFANEHLEINDQDDDETDDDNDDTDKEINDQLGALCHEKSGSLLLLKYFSNMVQRLE